MKYEMDLSSPYRKLFLLWFRPIFFVVGIFLIRHYLFGTPQWEGGGAFTEWQRWLLAVFFGGSFCLLGFAPMEFISTMKIGSEGMFVVQTHSKTMFHKRNMIEHSIPAANIKDVEVRSDSESGKYCQITLHSASNGISFFTVPTVPKDTDVKAFAQSIAKVLGCNVVEV